MNANDDAIILLVDSAHGQYCPLVLMHYLQGGRTKPLEWGITPQQVEVLIKGADYPGGEDWSQTYWDTWITVLSDAEYTDSAGKKWRLFQDGDVFAYCDELLTDEQRGELFGP